MKRLDRSFLIGALLLIIGVIWGFMMSGVKGIEWLLLLSGIVLGILAGIVQGWSIARSKLGKIGRGKKTLWVIGTILILVVLKVAINVLIPSYLATSQLGIWLSIVFAVSGLLLGRSFYPSPSLKNSKS
ncbi:hypothetical protein [Bacillus sp. AFS017336]|uniref:hypothetical protein n=1 Tax=Bacillus sp. AFS017336 TaxID=2033489 RepID=UPI000BF05C78|nr:hypothetical protein [Bacillus sp. AFS017336]PEL14394.1 hypothetical protein CN601_00530 [Bacillus sp. AFS017336]